MKKCLTILIFLYFLSTTVFGIINPPPKQYRIIKSNNFKAVYDTRTDFSYVLFLEKVSFDSANFKSISDFSDSKFFSSASFKNVDFNQKTYWISTEFKSEVSFNSRFYDKANFSASAFDSTASFSSSKFYDKALFFVSKFNDYSFFDHVLFDSVVSFENVHFNSYVSFSHCTFNNTVYFNNATINSNIGFNKCSFDSILVLNGVNFKSNFSLSLLPKYLDLSNVSIQGGTIDFFESKPDSTQGYCLINLVNSDISKIRMLYTNFKLYFPAETSWDAIESVYEQLLGKTKTEGFLKSYEKLDKEYRKRKYHEKYKKLGKLLNFIDKIWWDYGYNKAKIPLNTAILFVFFCFINSLFLSKLNKHIYIIGRIYIKIIKIDRFTIKGILSTFYYSIIYTCLIFFGLKLSLDKLKFDTNLTFLKIIGLSYFFTMYFVGLICLAFLSNYIITI